MNDQIVIDELMKLYKKLHDEREALPPGVSHSRKHNDKELKEKWHILTKRIYSLETVLGEVVPWPDSALFMLKRSKL